MDEWSNQLSRKFFYLFLVYLWFPAISCIQPINHDFAKYFDIF